MSYTRNFKVIQPIIWIISAGIFAISGCEHSIAPSTSSISTFPFVIEPKGTIINGGTFISLSGSFEGFSINNNVSTDVALNYSNWPGAISVKLDGSSVSSYNADINSSSPLGSHTWEVDSNIYGVPAMTHSIRGLSSLEITSPGWHDTVTNKGFTITWTLSTDTTSRMMIMFTPTATPQSDSTWTSSSYVVYAKDNGSYTFADSLFAGVHSGWLIDAALIRYVYDCDTISGKNYLFLNGFQRTGEYILQ